MQVSEQQEVDIQISEILSDIGELVDEGKAVENAGRISMLARGVQGGEVGNIWPLSHSVSHTTTLLQACERQYGSQGVLLKESPGFFGGWEQRYVVLKEQRFVYKQNAFPISQNAGILNFNLLSCELVTQMEGNLCVKFKILIKNSEKEFVFKGHSQKQTKKWLQLVDTAIRNSEGWQKNFSYLSHYPRFWRKDYVSEAEFGRSAQAGDILLFRGLKNSSMMQRAITRDEYDHVAVVVVNQMGEPLVFEANGGFGVGLCPWWKFVERRWWNQYELVVHRKLQVLRTADFLEVVQKFVGANMGKQYKFSFGDYLFYRNSTVEKDHEFYFCSSLVAKLYKRLELLPSERSCKQYLPSSFSDKEQLDVRGDGRYGYAYLQDEKIIVFEEGART